MKRLRWRLALAGTGLAALLVAALGWAAWLQVTGNVHEVRRGELYRSAQLAPDQLARVIDRERIASILNLRGRSETEDWWIAETAMARQKGPVHADFAMSASAVPPPERLAELVALMRSLPKPILIHCHAGSDRTGLAAALYLAAIDGDDEETAEAQLSFRFGHVALPFSQAWPMDQTWERLEASLGFEGS
ncbi:tyrosine-protein phosphatase [Amaricoccus sp. B4]|uniref:tyrosine-protein phosphatase n=1 Tax=Amaricoccus sp. B4 TaxID=3368557 RepID=UPI003721EEE6